MDTTIGYLASIFIGISLGLIGGGGSILTVPVLVYLFHIDAMLATVYSLFIVGTTSIVGAFSSFRKGWVNLKTALIFGLPSVIAVFLTRRYLVPAIPQKILTIGRFTIDKSILLLLLFAVLMIFASVSMIRNKNLSEETPPQKLTTPYPQMLAQGALVGIITGLVGAGGGFLIIPVLVNLLKLPMKTAVGTSLLIISLNSLMGFLFSLDGTAIQWQFLSAITAMAILGVLIGTYFSTKIKATQLKPVFGWFVLIMGIYIILKETLLA